MSEVVEKLMEDEVIDSLEMLRAADLVEFKTVDMTAFGWKTPKGTGMKIRLGSLSAEDIIKWQETRDEPKAKRNSGIRILIKSIVDGKGNRIGKDDDFQWFAKKPYRAVDHLVMEVLKLNGLIIVPGEDGKKENESLLDKAKNG